MAMQYKPTKSKKEKPAKAPKAQKTEKQVKFGSAMSLKTSRSVKAPKPTKAQKETKTDKPAKFGSAMQVKTNKLEKESTTKKATKQEKSKPVAQKFKGVKVEKTVTIEKNSDSQKAKRSKIVMAVVAVLFVIVAVVSFIFITKYLQQVKKIEIVQKPSKLIYLVGDEPNYDGLIVKVTRNNGETFTLRASDCELSGFRSNVATDNRIVSVGYEGKYTSFVVQILDAVKPKPQLKSIRLDPLPKTEYKLGDPLDVSGSYIILEYVDGSTERTALWSSDVYGFGQATSPGTYTLTVQYIVGGVLKTTTYTITVTE